MREPNNDTFDVDWDSIEENAKTFLDSHTGESQHSHDLEPKPIRSTTKKQKKKKRYLILKILLGILIFILCMIIGIVIAFFILRAQGKKQLLNNEPTVIQTIEEADTKDNGQTVVYNGKTYTYNPNVTSILFMGVDKETLDLENGIVGTGGQADAIYLLSYDTSNGDIKLISFSRDTLVDVDTYATNGDYVGVENMQLCLAYAYGDGKELSAENVVTSVQRIMYNIPINSYFAMDLSAIPILNDDIGGVTLNSLITIGPFVQGENITLKGNQSITYVRTRDTSVLDSNVGRMKRQQQYITAFANQLVPAVQKDISVPLTLYNDASEYIVTNLTPSKITYLASNIASSYNGLDIITVPGSIEANKENGTAQFIPDSVKLYEILLDTFYTTQ